VGHRWREHVVPGTPPEIERHLFGRDREIARLDARAENGKPALALITGVAGAGKTALAVRAAQRLAPRFSDGQLYADLRGHSDGLPPADPAEVLDTFLRRLDVPPQDVPPDLNQRSAMLVSLLATRRMLILLENAATARQVRPLLPVSGRSLVLVTSRDATALGLDADEVIVLDAVSDDDAAARILASRVWEGRTAPDDAQRLRVHTGGLPLALMSAGSLLGAHPSWSVDHLERLLAAECAQFGGSEDHAGRLRAVLGVVCQNLSDEAARLFRVLSLHPCPDFDRESAAELAGIDGDAVGVLGELGALGLLTEHWTDRYSVPDAVRPVARQVTDDTLDEADRRAALRRLVDYHAELANYLDLCTDPQRRAAEGGTYEGSGLPSAAEALEEFRAERLNFLTMLDLAAAMSLDDQVRDLAKWITDPLTQLGYVTDVISVGSTALAVARRAGDGVAEGWALNGLGRAYTRALRFDDAVRSLWEAAEAFHAAGDEPGELQSLADLATAYRAEHRMADAAGALQRVLTLTRKLGERRAELSALVQLGACHAESGQFGDAIRSLKTARKLARVLGVKDGEADIVGSLGAAYVESAKPSKGARLLESAVTLYREAGDQALEGICLLHLGDAYWALRRPADAIRCFEQATAISRATEDPFNEMKSMTSLGVAYQQSGQSEQALDCLLAAAQLARDLGMPEEAERLEQQAAVAPRPQRRGRAR
jgi:tetratricopeptide (TPR) repeat protein